MKPSNATVGKRFVEIGWIVLSCIPFLNWIGFLWLGKTLNRKKWTTLGYIHFALSLVSLSLLLGWLTDSSFLNLYYSDFELVFPYLMFLSWFIGIIQVWWISGEARKRLNRQTSELQARPTAAPIAMSRMDRVGCNVCLVFLALVPLCGLSLVHMGRTMESRKLEKRGWITLAICLGLELVFLLGFVFDIFALIYSSDSQSYIACSAVITQMLVLFVWFETLFPCAANRQEYIRKYAEQHDWQKRNLLYEAGRQQYPCLNSTSWKIKNSVWMLWCLTPLTAPFSLIHLGISEKNWKQVIGGVAAIVSVSWLILIGLLFGVYIEDAMTIWITITLATWVVVIACCLVMQRAHLLYRAKKCGGYMDAFDIEEAQLKQNLNNRNEAFHDNEE
jgi:hypothetical protein